MSKASVLTLIQDLSLSTADATAIERYYRDVVYDLAAGGWLAQATLVATTAQLGSYSMPDTSVSLLGLFYDDRQLTEEGLRSLEAFDSHWRDIRGVPIVYVVEGETEGSFLLVPTPEIASKDFIFMFGRPFGVEFPEYALAVVHTETRDDLPAWLELPVAFKVLALEFMRESDHQDKDFAAACGQLAVVLLTMVT